MSQQPNGTPPLLLPRFTHSSLQEFAAEHGIRLNGGGDPPKLEIYDLFIDHCATPSTERLSDQITDKDFQRKYQVSHTTLWKWSNRKGFDAEVKKRRKAWAQSRVPDVLNALYIGAVKGKRAKEIALFLEYAEGFKSKVIGGEGGTKGDEFTMDDVRRMLEFLPPERRKYFNDLIIKIFNEAAEYARRASEASESPDDGQLRSGAGELPRQADNADAPGGPAHPVAEDNA